MPTIPPINEYDFTLAVAALGHYRKHIREWMIWYQSQPEIIISIRDPRDLILQLYNIDQSFRKLLIETGRIN